MDIQPHEGAAKHRRHQYSVKDACVCSSTTTKHKNHVHALVLVKCHCIPSFMCSPPSFRLAEVVKMTQIQTTSLISLHIPKHRATCRHNNMKINKNSSISCDKYCLDHYFSWFESQCHCFRAQNSLNMSVKVYFCGKSTLFQFRLHR